MQDVRKEGWIPTHVTLEDPNVHLYAQMSILFEAETLFVTSTEMTRSSSDRKRSAAVTVKDG